MSTSRKLSVKKPVRLIFSGGFLGAGKTTALASLAKRLIQKEMRVGFITNDQSENLVDTIIVRQMLTDLGVPVEEVVKGEIGHLKFVFTSAGRSMWANLTHLTAEPAIGGEKLAKLSRGTLIINARVRLEPEDLESIVRDSLIEVSNEMAVQSEVDDLQCFSPAYPEPLHIIRKPAA